MKDTKTYYAMGNQAKLVLDSTNTKVVDISVNEKLYKPINKQRIQKQIDKGGSPQHLLALNLEATASNPAVHNRPTGLSKGPKKCCGRK